MAETAVNLTVIGDRSCSTTRTYLEHLRAAGYRPRRLWLIDFGSKSRLTRLRDLARRIAVRRRTPKQQDEYNSLCIRLQVEAGCAPIDHQSVWRPSDYAQEVRSFRARDFDDPILQERMARASDTAFLYTNGGRVPASLLNLPEIRILHIHPGIVPDLRGSDCLLWSAAVRRKLGVSCFYMSSGIDEGALIGQREFELPRLPALAPLVEGGSEPTAYRALLFAVDPHLRAQLLLDVLRAHPGADLRNLPAREQTLAARPAYLWMHPRLRLQVMKESFL
jgi:hypothetical protein